MAKTAKTWPNGLGWDVGASEVRDCVSFFRDFIPTTHENKQPRHKRRDFPRSPWARTQSRWSSSVSRKVRSTITGRKG